MAIWNERIRDKRLEKGITLAQIATALGVTEATAQRYESGSIKSVPYEHMCAYGEIFGCSPAYLMGWEKEVDATISKELQISKEALYTINKFPLTIDKNTGHSLMDIFNAIVTNAKFSEILHSILLYIARDEDDWNKMVSHFSKDFKHADKSTLQSLCYTNIIKEFERLLSELLNSDIDTFNSVEKTSEGGLIIGIKPENKYLYELNAAHERTDIKVTDEMIKHDDDIMDSDDF